MPDPNTPSQFVGIQTQDPSVRFDVVPNLPDPLIPVIPSQPGQAYWGYGCDVWQWTDMGLGAAPVAGTYPGPTAIWRKHGGMTKKVFCFLACRFGVPPVPPGTSTGSANDVLMDKLIVCPGPEIMADGMPLYWIFGVYLYTLQQTPADSDPITYPSSPVLPTPNTPVAINQADFNPNIYKAQPPSGWNGGPITF